MPWSSTVYPPRVTQRKEEANVFDVLIYTIDKRYFSFVEDEIRKLNN